MKSTIEDYLTNHLGETMTEVLYGLEKKLQEMAGDDVFKLRITTTVSNIYGTAWSAIVGFYGTKYYISVQKPCIMFPNGMMVVEFA